jgi:hypothetical protein
MQSAPRPVDDLKGSAVTDGDDKVLCLYSRPGVMESLFRCPGQLQGIFAIGLLDATW